MRLQKGGGPPIAEANRLQALENIRAKCSVLEDWLARKPALSEKGVISGFPRTKRQFLMWRCEPSSIIEGLPWCELRSTSNETLNGHEIELQWVERLLTQVLKYERSELAHSKPHRISRLEQKLADSERLRAIAERSLVASLAETESHRAEICRLKAELEITGQRAKELLQDLEAELGAERKRTASLTRTLAKTTRLQRTS